MNKIEQAFNKCASEFKIRKNKLGQRESYDLKMDLQDFKKALNILNENNTAYIKNKCSLCGHHHIMIPLFGHPLERESNCRQSDS